MKYLITFLAFLVVYASQAQMKGDTTKPSGFQWGRNKRAQIWNTVTTYYNEGDVTVDTLKVPTWHDIVFLMQQNIELSERLDRLETKLDSTIDLLKASIWVQNQNTGDFLKSLDSLRQRPYLFIDLKTSRPGVWLTNTAGEYQIFITPLNYK